MIVLMCHHNHDNYHHHHHHWFDLWWWSWLNWLAGCFRCLSLFVHHFHSFIDLLIRIDSDYSIQSTTISILVIFKMEAKGHRQWWLPLTYFIFLQTKSNNKNKTHLILWSKVTFTLLFGYHLLLLLLLLLMLLLLLSIW